MKNIKASAEITEHMKFGLTNAQETIRFIDQKVGGAMAVVALIGGVLLYGEGLVQGLICCLNAEKTMPWHLRYLILSLAGITVVLFLFGIWFAMKTLTARGRMDSQMTFLFPLAKEKASASEVRADYEEKLRCSNMQNLPCDELVSQLSVLAVVLRDKISSSRLMCRLFGCFFIAMTSLRILVLLTMFK